MRILRGIVLVLAGVWFGGALFGGCVFDALGYHHAAIALLTVFGLSCIGIFCAAVVGLFVYAAVTR